MTQAQILKNLAPSVTTCYGQLASYQYQKKLMIPDLEKT